MALQYWIHPSIGVARLGDSDAHYLGPELPGRVPNEGEPYRDARGRVKRQGQRFRIYEYEVDGDAARPLREITAADAAIAWQVRLVNRKAAFDETSLEQDYWKTAAWSDQQPVGAYLAAAPRNTDIRDTQAAPFARRALIIDSGEQHLAPGETQVLQGHWNSATVVLGEIHTDPDGRLVVLGGRGVSACPGDPAPSIDHFANNDGWYDDSSDGIVSATLDFGTGPVPVDEPARVLVAPPRYAPAIDNVITLYDLVLDAARRMASPLAVQVWRPAFHRDILPILRRAVLLQWVSEVALTGHGGGGGEFLARQEDLGDPSSDFAAGRARVFGRLRRPDGDLDTDIDRMPQLNGIEADAGDPHRWRVPPPSLTGLQYALMERWRDGDFEADAPVEPPAGLEALDPAEQVRALDRAALDAGTGAPLYPGIESWAIMALPAIYSRPLRVRRDIEPGRLTEGNALPWQADFLACSVQWWPSHRPNEVFRLGSSGALRPQADWVPGGWSMLDMVKRWRKLGFVVRIGAAESEGYVETERRVS